MAHKMLFLFSVSMCFKQIPGRSSRNGSTLVEAIIAAAVLAVAVGGICLTCWKTMNVLRVNKAEAAATSCLVERTEQMRNSTWSQITSGTYIQAALNTPPSASSGIPGFTEELTLNAFPTATTAIDVTCSTSGSGGDQHE